MDYWIFLIFLVCSLEYNQIGFGNPSQGIDLHDGRRFRGYEDLQSRTLSRLVALSQ